MEVITETINKMTSSKVREVLVRCGVKYGFDAEEAYNWSIRECGMKKVGVVSDKKDKKAEDLIASLMDVDMDGERAGDRDDEVSVTNSCELSKEGNKKRIKKATEKMSEEDKAAKVALIQAQKDDKDAKAAALKADKDAKAATLQAQ